MDAATKYSNYRNAMNEGGEGYNPHEAGMLAEAAKKVEDRESWIDAHYGELKMAWNNEIKFVTAGNTQITMHQVHAVEKKVGVTLAEIKAAKVRNEK